MENEYQSIKVPIMHRSVPYVYLKMSNDCNRYRLSANYKYLNENYNLKMNFIRDLEKIYNNNNKFFNIVDNKIIIKDRVQAAKYQTWEVGDDFNKLNITRIIFEATTILILHRDYKGDINHSLFYASTDDIDLNIFLGE
jgi:hypothetical protein